MPKPVMVVGGGIAGIQAALDLGDQGIKVYLVEKSPSIGGRMAQLDKTFPTLDCSSCILTPKMVSVARNPNIELLTYCEIKEIKGKAGDFKVKIIKKPRYVDIDKCTGCGVCTQKCPSKKVPNEFNIGLNNRTAIYIPFPQAVPLKAVIDPDHCLYFKSIREGKKGICRVCERFCTAKAIDFNQKPEEIELNVASIIFATGFTLDDPRKREEYGYGKYANVFTHLEFERMLSSTGPTNGDILRRSDGKHPKSIAFIQCVCSRDELTNKYCSAICCMSSTKEAILAKEHIPGVKCTVFFMDLRAFGKGYQEFYERAKNEFGIEYIKSRVAKIEEDPDTKNLILTYEDVLSTKLVKREFDMVILAVGVRPVHADKFIPIEEDGFAKKKNIFLDPIETPYEGIYAVGMIGGPKDIPDSVTEAGAAAMKASIWAVKKVVEYVRRY